MPWKNVAPVYLGHSLGDTAVPHWQSKDLADGIVALGGNAEVVVTSKHLDHIGAFFPAMDLFLGTLPSYLAE
jgi:hypothetical protein